MGRIFANNNMSAPRDKKSKSYLCIKICHFNIKFYTIMLDATEIYIVY